MKFILCEDKFLLNENPSFFLEERFILEEDILLEAQATLKQLVIDLNKLDTLLPSLIEVLPVGISLKILADTIIEDEKLVIEEQIKTGCKELQDLLVNKKNFKDLIDKIRQKAEKQPPEKSFSEEDIKILQPLCYKIASEGNSVKDRLKGIKSHKGELAEQVAALQERVPQLKSSIEELYKFFETPTAAKASEKPETVDSKITYSLKITRKKLKVGDSFTLKILADSTPEAAVKATFTSNTPDVATVSETGLVTAVNPGSAKITVEIAGQTLVCDIIVQSSNYVDWEELYKACTNCANRKEAYAAFWNGGLPKRGEANPNELPVATNGKMAAGYFEGEWGKHAARIKNLGTPFMSSLTEFGWSAKLNPFIDLLKHLCNHEHLFLNDSAFSQVRSLYGSKVSEADLRGKGSLGELNLVRNPLFYKKDGGEISDYLNWQHEVQNSNQIPSDSKLEILYANIVAENGKAYKLKDPAAYSEISAANFVYNIRKLTAYKEIIKTSFKVDGDKQKLVQATDEDIATILASITTSDKAKQLLTYLVNLYRVTNLNMLMKLFEEPFGDKVKANRNSVHTAFEDDRKFDQLVNTATKKYSLDQLKTLFTKLIEIAKL